ncbi:MAG: lysophospholipid acyltransferase family protein [Pseudomonadota bacterium]
MISFLKNVLSILNLPIIYTILALDTFIIGGSTIILSFIDRTGNGGHYLGKLWSRMNLLISLVRTKVRGLQNIKPGQPYIIMSNHRSHYDVWALYGFIPLQFRWVMKIELRKIPILGLSCERIGHIYIDRGKTEKARKILEAAGERIRAGTSVVFFPEGTRSPDGKLLPFKKGGFMIALEARVPILPITINGTSQILPKGSLRPRPGTIEINIHPPIHVDGFSVETRDELIEKVREVIESKLE